MAAALFRRGTGLCVRCIHRELCRVVWRPQTALFSSKPPDRKQPRRTHIKKAKPQPAVDVAKLLEQLFSQRRPGPASPAGKARHAQASSMPTKPPASFSTSTKVSTSSVPPLSKTEPATSVFPAASSLPKKNATTFKTASLSTQPKSASPANPKTSFSSETPQQSSLGFIQVFTADGASNVTVATTTTSDSPPTSTTPAPVAPTKRQTSAETIESKVATEPVLSSSAYMVKKNVETSSFPAAAVESFIETAIESPIEASLPPVEALETRAAVVEGPVDAPAEDVRTKSIDSGVIKLSQTDKEGPVIETTIESSVDASTSALGTQESRAAVAESTVEPTVDAATEEVGTKSIDSGVVDASHIAIVEPLIETTMEPSVEVSISALGTQESRATVAESTVETSIEAEAHTAAQAVQPKSTHSGVVNLSHTAKVEPLIETTIESSVEANISPSENRAAVAESTVYATVDAPAKEVRTNSTDSGVVDFTHTVKVEPLIETTIESSVGSSTSPSENRAAVAAVPVEPTVETGADTVADSLSHAALIQIVQESAALPLKNEIESTVESTVESSSGNVAVEEGVIESEEMNLESVTLNLVKVLVESLKTDELLRTKTVLDEKAEKRLRELLVQTGIGAEYKAAAETENSTEFESEILTKVLSTWESLSEDLQELEGETGMLVKELLCHVPAVLSKTSTKVKTSSDFHATAPDPPVGANRDFLHVEEEKPSKAEAMTLESITLADVKAEVGSLECKVLQDTRDALENEADVLAKEEKMEVRMEREDVADFEDTIGAEILTLDYISEATDALEAETSVMLESMFGSEQGLRQPPDALLVGQKQDEAIVQEAEKEFREQDGTVLEAMSFESVTLAEIEASLGTLESESLNETTAYLEEEAEILAGEKRMEVEDGAASEEMTEALTVESLSLPEADALSEALQTDALMEELLFSVPGHLAGVTESQTGQEVVREDILDATVATGSGVADTAAAETDDLPAPPALREVLLGQEEKEEEGAKPEDLEIQEGIGTNADLDPVQRLFLEKIREYNTRRLSGEPVEVEPDYERSLSEETAKLQRLYGGGDLSSFPQFTFIEPTMDQDSK